MNVEFFIANKIFRAKENRQTISQTIVRIAVIGISLGMVVMILAISIVTGFQQEIRNKVIGFGSHINIVNYDTNSSYETQPIKEDQSFYPKLSQIDGIRHVQVFATKAGIIKTDNDFQGVVIKGVGDDFDWSFFKQNLLEGQTFQVINGKKSNSVVISNYLAKLLKLKVGDDLLMYFIQDPPRYRKFNISGVYETSLEELDKTFVLADIAHVQKLNDWTENQVSGFEVLIDNYNDLDAMFQTVYDQVGYSLDEEGGRLRVRTIKQAYSQIFVWLDSLNINVVIILVLMVLVAGFNMISGLLILILERTNMVGVLKALGTRNWSVQKIFLYNSVFLIGRGMLWGNVIGIVLCLLQKYVGIIKLDASTYYIATVPINLDVFYLLILNIATLAVTTLMLVLPSIIITRIKPIKAIRFG